MVPLVSILQTICKAFTLIFQVGQCCQSSSILLLVISYNCHLVKKLKLFGKTACDLKVARAHRGLIYLLKNYMTIKGIINTVEYNSIKCSTKGSTKVFKLHENWQSSLLVNRMTNTLIIDRLNINYETHIM